MVWSQRSQRYHPVHWDMLLTLGRRLKHGPSNTTRILGYFSRALPDSNETICVLNH